MAGRFGVAEAWRAESDGEPSDQSAGCAPGASPPQRDRLPRTPPPKPKPNGRDKAAQVSLCGFGQHENRSARVLADLRQPLRRRTSFGAFTLRRTTCAVRRSFSTAELLVARRRRITVDVHTSYLRPMSCASPFRIARSLVHKKVSLSTAIRRYSPFSRPVLSRRDRRRRRRDAWRVRRPCRRGRCVRVP